LGLAQYQNPLNGFWTQISDSSKGNLIDHRSIKIHCKCPILKSIKGGFEARSAFNKLFLRNYLLNDKACLGYL
jgi:hypothetical protein